MNYLLVTDNTKDFQHQDHGLEIDNPFD